MRDLVGIGGFLLSTKFFKLRVVAVAVIAKEVMNRAVTARIAVQF